MDFCLDKAQEKAVFVKTRNCLVVAAPGSGKTTVIVNRTLYLIHNIKVNPANIVVLTFTRAQAENMKKRFYSISKNEKRVFFGTFHSLFYNMLKESRVDRAILNESEAYTIIKEVLLCYLEEIRDETIRKVINDISIIKIQGVLLENYIASIDSEAFKQCFMAYEQYKNKKNLMDFEDIMLESISLLKKNNNILSYYQHKYKFILVDEFQDCDKLQIQLLKLLCVSNSIFAVGDENQSIYGFRGSSSQYILDFKKIFREAEIIYLSNNFRNPENVVFTSEKLIEQNKIRSKKKVMWKSDNKGEINVICSKNQGYQAEKLAAILINMNISNSAIIYRTNSEKNILIDVFVNKAIPFCILDEEFDFFEYHVLKDILAYITLSLDNSHKESFIRIVNRPNRYISKLSLERFKGSNIKGDVFNCFSSIDCVSLVQLKEIRKLKSKLKRIKKFNVIEAFTYIYKDIGYENYIKLYCVKNSISYIKLESIIKLVSFFVDPLKPVKELLDIAGKKKYIFKDQQVVLFMTMHKAKGMEFDNVFIINCNEGNIPYSKNGYTNIEEERRLFYVAITRTRENLWLSYNEVFNGTEKLPSIFLKECGCLLNVSKI